MKRDYIYITAIVALFLCYANLRSFHADSTAEQVSEVERTDVSAFYAPEPETIDYDAVRVSVPMWLFNTSVSHTESGNHQEENFPIKTDSVEVAVRIETRTYRDSTYEARVSGPSLGGIGPSLDWIHTYDTTREITKTNFVIPRKWWEVRATAGLLYTPEHSDLWAGITADRYIGRWSYGVSIGYALSGNPYAEVRTGFRIFSNTK